MKKEFLEKRAGSAIGWFIQTRKKSFIFSQVACCLKFLLLWGCSLEVMIDSNEMVILLNLNLSYLFFDWIKNNLEEQFWKCEKGWKWNKLIFVMFQSLLKQSAIFWRSKDETKMKFVFFFLFFLFFLLFLNYFYFIFVFVLYFETKVDNQNF